VNRAALGRVVGVVGGVIATAIQGAGVSAYRTARVPAPGPLPAVMGDERPARGRQFGGRFGGVREDLKIQEQFDGDQNGMLDAQERVAARAYVESAGGRGRGGRQRMGSVDVGRGATLRPSDVRAASPSVPLYDEATLRTLFLEFENHEWEGELMAFKDTDVEVPAQLLVDGHAVGTVGVQFHGNSSFRQVPAGLKHSIHLSVDAFDSTLSVLGYRTLTLLNAHEDPTLLRTVLFMHVARQYIPAPKANFVRVVINGELWGVYSNQQQFNKDFLVEAYGTSDGARWKVPGSPGGRGGGLSYLGDDIAAYRRVYEIKSKDDPKDWEALMALTRTLAETPPGRLEAALAPVLDVDGALRFLALDNALVNNGGYWTRASDYSLYLDPKGRFHVIPYDANETFSLGGRGGFGGRAGTPELDPLVASGDASKALAARLLAVPSLRTRYLAYVQEIARDWLDWDRLGPLVERYRRLIGNDVRRDVKKLDSTEEFEAGADTLKAFADRRRAALLSAAAPE